VLSGSQAELITGTKRASYLGRRGTAMPKALIVDDEPTDLQALCNCLTSAGYEVLTAADGNSALKLFHGDAEGIDLLVTDVAMNPVNGCDLAMELVRLKPTLRVVFVSGYVGAEALQYENSPFDFGFVQKPFSPEELMAKINSTAERVFTAGGSRRH
jgi:two-component system cell cycle sensor histidine kinase/response regulator CckA